MEKPEKFEMSSTSVKMTMCICASCNYQRLSIESYFEEIESDHENLQINSKNLQHMQTTHAKALTEYVYLSIYSSIDFNSLPRYIVCLPN